MIACDTATHHNNLSSNVRQQIFKLALRKRHKGIYLQAVNMYRGIYKMFKLNGNWTEEVIDDQEAHPFCDTDNQFLKI